MSLDRSRTRAVTREAKRRFTAILALALATSLAPRAHAQSEADKADAEAAFDLGKKLLAEGKTADACPKFAESVRLDPGIGSLLYLADCHEKVGQTASAWAEFREAEALAKRNNDSRETVAHDRAAVLEPKLAKLVVLVPADVAATPSLEVRRDDGVVGQPLWGAAIPVDPGSHRIIAAAPGKKPWAQTVAVAAGAPPVEVTVPPLVDAPLGASPTPGAQPLTPPPNEPPRSDGKTQRLLGLGAMGVGVVGLGLGTYFGLHAKSKLDDSNADGHCHDGNHCDAIGTQARSDALSAATMSTVAFTVGVLAAAGGVVLYLTAPHAPGPSVAVATAPGPQGGWVGVRGAF